MSPIIEKVSPDWTMVFFELKHTDVLFILFSADLQTQYKHQHLTVHYIISITIMEISI